MTMKAQQTSIKIFLTRIPASVLFIVFLFSLLFTFSETKAQVKSIYGVTRSGGKYGVGTIFRVDTNANNYTLVHSFKKNLGHPKYAQTLCKLSNGIYYGIATIDLATHKYAIYCYDASTDIYEVKKFFTNDIPNSSLKLHPNGFMYFTTKKTSAYNINGSVMRFDPKTNTLQSVLTFYGSWGVAPVGDLLITSSGVIYGTTSQGSSNYCGTLYKLSFNGSYTLINVVSNFLQLTTGYYCEGGLVEASNGKVYGVCSLGGSNGKGTIFELDTTTGVITKKIDLDTLITGTKPKTKMTIANNGKLYGVCSEGGVYGYGVLYKFDPNTSIFTKILNFNNNNQSLGSYPLSNLFLASNGKLYGTCSEGGLNNKGILFEYNPISNLYSKKKDFHSTTTGAYPLGGIVEDNGILYGICEKGGVVNGVFANRGTIFSYGLMTNTLNKEMAFELSIGGSGAIGGLTKASNGKIYGVTRSGGEYEFGVLYEFDPQTNQFQKLYEFDGTVGKWPSGKLLITQNNTIFGITMYGGNYDKGILYKYNISSGVFSKVIDFHGSSGTYPKECPILGPAGILYGITMSGGTYNKGVIYSLNPLTGQVATVVALGASGGLYNCVSGLFLASNGKMYTTTQHPNNGGILEFNPQTSNISTKHVFTSNEGNWSQCTFIEGGGHKLYGSTKGDGINNLGTLFEYNTDSNTVSVLTNFNSFTTTGSEPTGALFLSGSHLYGLNSNGGSYSKGTLLDYDLLQNTLGIKTTFNGANGGDPWNVQFLEYNCYNSYDTITSSACDQYVGKSLKVYTTSGTYSDTSYNACSAFQIDLLNLTIITIDTLVTKQSTALHANQNNATYQWLYCDTAYKIIPGATSQNFSPVVNGNYAVIITQGSCVDTSSCHSFLNVGMSINSINEKILIYPNPAQQYINIQFNKQATHKIRIRNIYGLLLYEVENSDLILHINTQSYISGVYVIEITDNKGVQFRKKIIIH